MGIALFMVWRKSFSRLGAGRALGLFGVQLALNVLWSIVFFGMQSPLFGFAVIVVLWVAVLATMVLFYGISKGAGLLLLPYFLWGSFASVLNLSILILNP
jgi:tryptophan-rich sensory protein